MLRGRRRPRNGGLLAGGPANSAVAEQENPAGLRPGGIQVFCPVRVGVANEGGVLRVTFTQTEPEVFGTL